MQNIIILILSLFTSFILYDSYVQKDYVSEYYTMISNYINNKIPILTETIYNSVYYEENTTIYTKEKLGSMTSSKQYEIIKNTVDKIRKDVVSAANKGDSIYYWIDSNYILDKQMYDKVVAKLKIIFPDTNIIYKYPLDRSITVDWR